MTKFLVILSIAASLMIVGCNRNSYVDRTRAPGVDGPKERHPDAPPEEEKDNDRNSR